MHTVLRAGRRAVGLVRHFPHPLSIRTKLIAGSAISLIALAIVGWWGVVGMGRINEQLNAINTEQFVPARTIAEANIALIAWDRATLNYVLAEDTQMADKYERDMFDQENIVFERLQTLSEAEQVSERGKEFIRELEGKFQLARPIRDRVVVLSRVGKQKEARQLVWAELRPIVDELEVTMAEFPQLKASQLAETLSTTEARLRQDTARLIWAIGIALAASLLISLLFARTIIGSVRQLIKGTEEIGRGNLECPVEVRTRDELGQLADAFNTMAAKRKQAEKALRDTQEELVRQEKLAVLGQLAGGVGHELRNPLGAIKNAAYFLRIALEKPEPEVKETMEILEKEVETSERIITSLLDFARPKPLTQRKVDVNDVVQETLSRAGVPGNVEVVGQLDEALPMILADPDQLGLAVGNIIRNAIQAMPEGGRLVVKFEASSPEEVSVSFADTGAGIPKEDQGRLFEPLFTTKAKGIGLGLAITRTLVEKHAGTIEVRSEVGKGSTFTVRLPMHGEPALSGVEGVGK